ncbi:TfpX/TfpZ family type IV pilin accessory protein [Delftia acidovorans]
MGWFVHVMPKTKAAALHFLASLIVTILTAFLVFLIWFPPPYQELVGGKNLFLLVIAVDTICGPLLTAVVYSPLKSRKELIQDLGFIVLIQLTALTYGVHTIAQSRPVYLVFEVDRFRVITVADIQKEKLRPQQGGLHELPWLGPIVIGIRDAKDNKELMESLDLSLNGVAPSSRPEWWEPLSLSASKIISAAHPIKELLEKHKDKETLIHEAIKASGLPKESLSWLPVTSFKTNEWIALINKQTAEVMSFAPIDGF